MHIRTIRKNENKYMARCSEYAKGKAKNAKCDKQHHIDCDVLLQNISSLLRKIAKFSLDNKNEFEKLVKNNLAVQQTDDMKKQQKRIPQITARLAQIDKIINKLYEDNALENIEQDRYQQLSQKYSEEYYLLKKELDETQTHLSDQISTSQQMKKFIKLVESYCEFNEITPTVINEFINKLVVHERDKKGAKLFVQHVEVHFNYIGKFENELTETSEPTEQEYERMREEIEEAKREKVREYHRAYRKPYRDKNIEKRREYERIKAREYRARKNLLSS
jgi:small-conductance mechanosensitive channel